MPEHITREISPPSHFKRDTEPRESDKYFHIVSRTPGQARRHRRKAQHFWEGLCEACYPAGQLKRQLRNGVDTFGGRSKRKMVFFHVLAVFLAEAVESLFTCCSNPVVE